MDPDCEPRLDAPRGVNYRRKRLTMRLTVGYVARIVAFRVYRLVKQPRGWTIADRYFYDSFVHYEMTGTAERVYAAFLRRLVPVPDAAILLTASTEAIARRRPQYSPEYVASSVDAYLRLIEQFPGLLEIRTDTPESPEDRLEATLRTLLPPGTVRNCSSREEHKVEGHHVRQGDSE